VPAGTWHVIADAVVNEEVDVLFELVLRRAGSDTTLASWTQHFAAPSGLAGIYVPVELDVDVPALDTQDGDQLVYRYTGTNAADPTAFEPNADMAGTGRDTSFTLPD
jgi:hypothetical protein